MYIVSILPKDLVSAPNGMPIPRHPPLDTSLNFQAELVADLKYLHKFNDNAAWERSISAFMHLWLPGKQEEATKLSETVRTYYLALDRAKRGLPLNGDGEEGQVLCDTLFSLAYGTLLLLSHTTLRLVRGRRYGILGPNGAGKTTLMRQLRDGKVENFPPQSQLRCVMVEHALQGEDTSLTVVDFVAAGSLDITKILIRLISYVKFRRCTVLSVKRPDQEATHRSGLRRRKTSAIGW